MDAVEFIKQVRRMGKQKGEAICFKLEEIDTEIVEQVEQWAKEHPVKTRQSEFLKMWPDAKISDDGLPSVAPCQLDVRLIHGESKEDCEKRGVCNKCRRDFWLKEVNESKED